MELIYPPQDLSSYLQRSETGQFVASVDLYNTGSYLYNLIIEVSGQGGGGGSGVSEAFVLGVSGALQSQIDNFSDFNPNDFVSKTGLNETVSGQKTFRQIYVKAFNGEGVEISIDGLSGLYSQYSLSGPSVRLLDGTLRDEGGNATVNWRSKYLSGNWSTDTNPEFDENIINLGLLKAASGYLEGLISASAAGVSTLNGLSGSLNILGTGNVSVFIDGQSIIISGGEASGGGSTGDYYLNSNPSGFLNEGLLYQSGIWLEQKALRSPSNGGLRVLYWDDGYLVDLSNNIVVNWFAKQLWGGWTLNGTGVLNITSGDNRYYPLFSNPEGYIKNADLTGASGTLQFQINNISSGSGGATGDYYLNSNPSGFINGEIGSGLYYPRNANPNGYLDYQSASSYYVRLTGTDHISGNKFFHNGINLVDTIIGDELVITEEKLVGAYAGRTGHGGEIDLKDLFIRGYNGQLKFSWDINTLTGGAWNVQDPSGGLNNIVNVKYLADTSGVLNTTIIGASGVLASLIAASSAGVISLNTISGNIVIQGINGNTVTVDGQNIIISGLYGALTSGNADLRYYPVNNPSGFITSGSTGQFITTGQTGQFASLTFVNNQISQVTGQVKSINNVSGDVTIIGAGLVSVSVNGSQITVSGASSDTSIQGVIDLNRVEIPQFASSLFVNFSNPFSGTPIVVGSLQYTGDSPVHATITGINPTGFGIIFSNAPTDGYFYNYLAISGNIMNIGSQNGGGFNPNEVTTITKYDRDVPPANLHPWSDDFTGNALKPDWSGFQASTTTSGVNKSTVSIQAPMSAGNVTRGIIKGIPRDQFASGQTWTIIAKFYPSDSYSPGDGKVGMFLGQNLIANPNTSPLIHLQYYLGGNPKLVIETASNYNTSFNEVAYARGRLASGVCGGTVYFKIVRESSSSYKWAYSANGVSWDEFSTYTPAFDPECFGLFSNNVSNSHRWAAWDWVRIYSGDPGMLGEEVTYYVKP